MNLEQRRVDRLHALGVLDTPADDAFDAIARLAQGLCGTPIALVSLVDERRQWFRANVGLPGVDETPRELAFCAHAIQPVAASGGVPQPLAVPDARRDARFATNPLVTGAPHIRFYLGAPILLSDGLAMGTVCVIDRNPREVQPGEREQLQDLARVAAGLLEAREQARLLQREQQRLARLMDGTRATTWEIDLHDGSAHVEGEAFEWVPAAPGASARAGLSDWLTHVHPMDRQRASDRLMRHLLGQTPLYEVDVRRLDGQRQWRWMHDRGRIAARAVDGTPTRLAGLTIDAHERLSAQRALERERRLLSAGPCVLLRCDAAAQWRLVEASSNVQALLGRDWSELAGAGRTLLGLLHPDDPPLLPPHGAPQPRRGLRLRLQHATGDWRVVDATLLDEAPEPGCDQPVRAYLVDATERVQMEAALQQREQQMQAVVDSAMDAIVAVDEQARVVLFNPAASRIFGIPREAALGQPLSRFVPERLRERHQAHFEGFRREGTSARAMGARSRLLGVDASGREFPIEVTIARTHDAGAALYTAIVRDVSERVAAEQAQRALSEAEAASRAKSAFLSRVSHELRTPLNSMLGFASLLLSDGHEPLSPAQAERVGLVRRSGQHLLSLIDDILDLSRIEQGAMALTLEPLNLGELARWAALMLAPNAQEQQVTVKLPPTLDDHWVLGDRRGCRQIVLNLVSNAIKYNRPGGTVTLSVKQVGEQRHLAVADTGRGLSAEQLQHLFEPFNRLGAEAGRTSGIGLGLVISRELARCMQGELAAESQPGQGTRMVLTLRGCAALRGTAPADTPALSPALRPLAGSAQAIYIEDEPVNALLMQHVFGRMAGWTLRVFSDAESGLAAVRADPPDVLMTDMNLPGLQGDEVVRRVKGDPATRNVCVIVVSADAMSAQVAQALALGADGYWTKPVDVDTVSAQLDALLLGRSRGG